MKILITGIHGFVGSNLVRSLKMSHSIYGLDIVTPEVDGVIKTFTWKELDNLPNVDIVIHLAGKAHDVKSKSKTSVYFEVNTELTKQMFDWFEKSQAKKFIFFSSVKAVADKVIGNILTEDVVPLPVGPYGESKIAAENYILSKSEQLIINNKFMYILRPCMIHGPGNKGNLNLLYKLVLKGIPYPLGAFENRRSFTSIDNLNFVIEQLVEMNVASGIYNIADDETLSTNELILLIANTLNKPSRIWKWSPNQIRFMARVGTKLHLPLNNNRFQKLTENYVVANNKLKSALGIQHMPVKVKEGFVKTIQSFQKV